MSLVARHLEANGIPTVIIGTARDIVEHCAVPRFLFVDFPLGNPLGEPDNPAQQRQILEMSFQLLEQATAPQTTWDAGIVWPNGRDWKDLVFTEKRPFLDDAAEAERLASNALYREFKASGKI